MSKKDILYKYENFYEHLLVLTTKIKKNNNKDLLDNLEKLTKWVKQLIENIILLDESNDMWSLDSEIKYDRYLKFYFRIFY